MGKSRAHPAPPRNAARANARVGGLSIMRRPEPNVACRLAEVQAGSGKSI
jgi:hypothetical protein